MKTSIHPGAMSHAKSLGSSGCSAVLCDNAVQPPTRFAPAVTVVGIIFATALSVLATGYALNDLFVYLPLTAYLRDSSLYPGNPLIEHLLRMPYPLYRAYALVDDQHALFAIFLVTRFATVVALYVLALQILHDRLAAALGVSLIVFTPGTFGTLGLTQVLLAEPVQYALATPTCLFALAAALAGRPTAAFILAGLAFNLQPILGAVTLALLAADLFLNEVVRLRRVSLAEAARTIGFGIIAAFPGLLMAALGPSTDLGTNMTEYLAMVRFGAYFHVLPSEFSGSEYLTTAIVVGYLCLGLRDEAIRPRRATLVAWFGAILAFCVAGTIFSEFLPVGLILKAMPFRSTLFLKVLGLLCCAAYLRRSIGRGNWTGQVVAFLAVAGMMVYPYLAILVLVICLAVEMKRTISSHRPRVVTGIYRAVVDFGGLETPLARYWSRLLVSLPAVLIVLTAPARPAVIRIPGDEPVTDQEALADWARTSTPRDSVVIAPPDEDLASFTVLAERSTVGNVKLAGQALFDPTFGSILSSRLSDLGCHVPDEPWCRDNTYASFDAERFRVLSARYGACYAVTRTSQRLELSELYHNDSFRVYALCGAESGRG
jgi:hypothetical protein